MKVELQSKKGLRTILSVVVDKKSIEEKIKEKLVELQTQVNLKGFRPGKVPPELIKKQFGKAVYGEVIDAILKETSSKAIAEKKIKIAGQPKIDLKTFGEGKDLNYELQVDALPDIKLQSLDKFKVTEYKVKIEKKIIEKKLDEIANQHKNFIDKKNSEKADTGNQVIFDYEISVDGKKIENGEGKGIQLELGKDLFIKGFDAQLVGVKKNDIKNVKVKLPENFPQKSLANKNANFVCKILNVKIGEKSKLDNEFAKKFGAKDLQDLKSLIEKQIVNQYQQALEAITKKQILDQLEKNHTIDLPKNLVDHELNVMTQNIKEEDKKKHKQQNEKLAKSRIKLGLILNEYGEKNNLTVSEAEVQNEINKQVRGMQGQEKFILEYYKKNPMALQSIKGSLYEEKIINSIKLKTKLIKKEITDKEAESLIKNFNNLENPQKSNSEKLEEVKKSKAKSKKISKK